MKENKSRKMKRKEIDEIIKMSVDMDIPDVKDEISDEEVLAMGYSLAPDDMLDRIKKGIAEKEEAKNADAKVYSFRKVGKRIVIAVAVFMLLFALSLSVKSVRVYVFGIVNRITDNAIKFYGTSDTLYTYDANEKQSYEDAEKALGVKLLKPTYLPEGFVFEQVKIYPESHIFFIYKNESNVIRIRQSLFQEEMNTDIIVHSDEGSSYTLKAHGANILVSSHKRIETDTTWLTAVWSDKTILYRIEGNCTEEEFEKFILNLE